MINPKKLVTGFVLMAILIPSVAFAATPTTTTTSAAYIASLKQLLATLEAELEAILATNGTTVVPTTALTPTTPAVTTTPISTGITISFKTQPEYLAYATSQPNANNEPVVYYNHSDLIKAAITTSNENLYVPIANGIVSYTSPSSPSVQATEITSCDTGAYPVTSNGLQYCLIQTGTTGTVDATFTYQIPQNAPGYAFGISSVDYVLNPASVVLTAYTPQGTIITSPTN